MGHFGPLFKPPFPLPSQTGGEKQGCHEGRVINSTPKRSGLPSCSTKTPATQEPLGVELVAVAGDFLSIPV